MKIFNYNLKIRIRENSLITYILLNFSFNNLYKYLIIRKII